MDRSILFYLLFCPVTVFAQVWNYTGIPYVTDNVPAAIMPELPTGADLPSAWTFDPCSVATPVWRDALNQYYVDPAHAAADDANNDGRGSPTAPRRTIPGLNWGGVGSWTLAANTQLFIVGDGNVFGNASDIENFTMPGTAEQPIWIIGVSTSAKPRLNLERYFMKNVSFVMWHNLHFGGTGSYRAQMQGGVVNNCWRHCLFTGSGTKNGSSRRMLSFTGSSENLNQWNVVYQCEMRDNGAWNPGERATDCMGVHVQAWSRYTWIINNEIYHMQGDSVMTGNSNYWNFNHALRPHYTYIAGNTFYENYENAYDCKDSYHTIFSENHCYGFRTYGSEPSANGTCIIFGQDSEGYLSGYTWIINNRIDDVNTGGRCSATSDTYRGYFIGNLITNANLGVQIEARGYNHNGTYTHADYASIVNNTLHHCKQGILNPRGTSHVEVQVDGNVIWDATGAYDVRLQNFDNPKSYTNNIVYRTAGGENVRLQGTTTTANNLRGTEPGLSNSYVPEAEAVAVDHAATEHPDYATFQTLYGLDIRQDLVGVSRPQGSSWDAGALEYAPATYFPTAPSNLRVE